SPNLALLHPNSTRHVVHQGNSDLTFTAQFPKQFKPIPSSQNNLLYHKHKLIQISPQFHIHAPLDFQYTFTFIHTPPHPPLIQQILFTHHILHTPLHIPPKPFHPYITLTLNPPPNPTLHLPPIHKPCSR
ncbi:accessory Sec system protein Asp2, partial [Staphylococcus aureus]|uniref:accessory Sec system protein Asp2 n=1 Tax=Staphylococcus aureus TaxID=1280 RepID=UPI0037DA147F